MTDQLQLNPKTTAVLVIDLQNDNLSPEGASGGTSGIEHARSQHVVEHAAQIAQAARDAGAHVIHNHFVIDPHAGGAGTNIPLFSEITSKPMVVDGTWGAEPVPGAEPQDGDITLTRARMSAFNGTQLDTILRNLAVTHVVVTGVHTSHAVGHTARDAADHGYHPILVSDATATTNAQWQQADLTTGLTDIATIADTHSVLAALR